MLNCLIYIITTSAILIWGVKVWLVTKDFSNFIPLVLLISLIAITIQVSNFKILFHIDNKEKLALCCFFLGGGCLGMTGVFAAMWFIDEVSVMPEVLWLRIVEVSLMFGASLFGFKCMFNVLKESN